MQHLWLIIKIDLLGFWNGLTRQSGGKLRGKLARTVIFTVLFFAFLTWTGLKAGQFMQVAFAGQPALLQEIEASFLSITAAALFLLLFFGGLQTLYNDLYQAEEPRFLLTTPLPVSVVFGSRYLKTWGSNLFTLLPFIGALWVGFGAAHHAPVAYYLAVALVLILATTLFTSFISLLVMLVMRFFSSPRIKQLVTVGSVVVTVAFILGLQMMGRTTPDPRVALELMNDHLDGQSGLWPHVWMAKSLLIFLDRYPYSFLESLFPLLLLSFVLTLAAIILARQTFLAGWAASGEFSSRAQKTRQSIEGQSPGWLRGPILGILRKDLLVLKRTPMMWSGLLVLLVIIGFSLTGMSQGPGGSEADVMVKTMVLILLLFLQSANSVTLMSLSLEGRSWWLMEQAPVKPEILYQAKYVYVYLINFLISGGAVLILTFWPGFPMHPWYISFPVVILGTSIYTSVSVGIDILEPSFEAGARMTAAGGDARRGTGTAKMMGSLMISNLLMALVGLAAAFPLYYQYIGLSVFLSPTAAAVLAGVIVVILAVVCNYTFYMAGCRRLKTMLAGKSSQHF
jgi:ABC-2 type transport system permease protein